MRKGGQAKVNAVLLDWKWEHQSELIARQIRQIDRHVYSEREGGAFPSLSWSVN